MNEMIKAVIEYCDSVSGAEAEEDLRRAQDILNLAHNVVTLTICAQSARLNGDICNAVSLESRADVALSNLWKLDDNR